MYDFRRLPLFSASSGHQVAVYEMSQEQGKPVNSASDPVLWGTTLGTASARPVHVPLRQPYGKRVRE